jgi:hypothetical protein
LAFKRLEGSPGDTLAMVTVVGVGSGFSIDGGVSEYVIDHA